MLAFLEDLVELGSLGAFVGLIAFVALAMRSAGAG
jgi:hypothetical protein